EQVDVIEVLVAPGDRVRVEQSLITLESEKATMEIPSPAAGVVRALHVAVGDKVSQGSPILTLEVEGAAGAVAAAPTEVAAAPRPPEPARAAAPAVPPGSPPARPAAAPEPLVGARAHASASVRRLARELGVDLARVAGSGPKNRILKPDVQAFVREALARGAPPPGEPAAFAIPPPPRVDFSKWGEIEV